MLPLALALAFAVQDAPPRDVRLERLVTLEGYFPFAVPDTAEAWAARREALRRQVLVAAGLWPEPQRCELAPVVHGAVEREGYTVEKVFFQALPGFYVTGNLYRPATPGPHPGVLCPHGHWAQGRFTAASDVDVKTQLEKGQERHEPNARYPLQARCAHLARTGAVVLHYDMIGYADSRQLEHRAGFGDVEAELWGMSWFGLQTLSSIRALDFLESLSDVDPGRLGVTGASGGGTQTFVLGAVDDRPDVLFPAVMVSTAMQGGCVCENASHLRVGTGNVELAAIAAPRPLGLTGANDWTVEIETKGLPELKQLYGLFGRTGRVFAKCHPDHPHNYNQIARDHMYGWFARHLGLERLPEPPLVPIEPANLSVYTAAHPRPDGALDLAGVRAELLRHAAGQRVWLELMASEDAPTFRRVVGGALATLTHAALPASADVAWSAAGDAPAEGSPSGLLDRGGRGERVHVTRAVAAGGPAATPVLVVREPRASTAGDDLEARVAARSAPLTTVDVLLGRAAEEGEALPVDTRHETYVGYTWGYNPTLFADRVQDVLTALAWARRDGQPVALVGLGEAAPWTACAAALAGSDAVERVVVQGGWDFDRVTSLDDPAMLPGALRWGGLPAFAALIAPTPMLWVGEERPPAVVRAAYAAAGAPEALQTLAAVDVDAIDAWLAR